MIHCAILLFYLRRSRILIMKKKRRVYEVVEILGSLNSWWIFVYVTPLILPNSITSRMDSIPGEVNLLNFVPNQTSKSSAETNTFSSYEAVVSKVHSFRVLFPRNVKFGTRVVWNLDRSHKNNCLAQPKIFLGRTIRHWKQILRKFKFKTNNTKNI